MGISSITLSCWVGFFRTFESVIVDHPPFYSLYATLYQSYVQGPGPYRCSFFCGESWFQANVVVLCASDWAIFARKMHIPWPEEWVGSFIFSSSLILPSLDIVQGETICTSQHCHRRIFSSSVLAFPPTICIPNSDPRPHNKDIPLLPWTFRG